MKLRKCVDQFRKYYRSYRIRESYKKLYRKIGEQNPSLIKPVLGEKEWKEKWSKMDRNIMPYSYRIFSRFIGQDLNIIPLELFANVIEPILCPPLFYPYYNDKNIFDKLFPSGMLPRTFVRNIRGVFYDSNYQFIENPISEKYLYSNKIILKPAVGGESGIGVQIFMRIGDKWLNKSHEELTIDYLKKNYVSDYIIQECLQQNDRMAFYNASSVNTIRIMTYRSVMTDEVFIPNAILRIGALGAEVDNAHHGGMFCGISPNGELGKYVCNYLGEKRTSFNGIDFSDATYTVPNYNGALDFAKVIAKQVIHHRLLALDIMIDSLGNPRLIEVNVGGFSGWLFQFTTGAVLGEHTDEVIDYCINHHIGRKNWTVLLG